MYRNGDVGPIFSAGDGVRDDSFMVGARTPWRRLFVSAALGYANVTPYTGCDGCIPSGQAESRSALAYDLSVHANEVVPGLALSYAGAIGPARVRYSAVTLGLELGWFGR